MKNLKDFKESVRQELQRKESVEKPKLYKGVKEKISKADCWKKFMHVDNVDTNQELNKDGNNFVACKDCLAVYAGTKKSGTSTLKKHPCSGPSADESQPGSLRPFLKSTTQVRATDKTKVSKALARMPAIDLTPFSQAEDDGFKHVADVILKIGVSLNRPVDIEVLLPTGNTVKKYVIEY